MTATGGIFLKFLAVILKFLGLLLNPASGMALASFARLELPKPSPFSVIKGDEKIQTQMPKTFRRENLRNP